MVLLERYADAMGVPSSSLCSVLVVQGLMKYNPALLSPPSPPQIEKDLGIDDVLAQAGAAAELMR